MDEVKRCGIEDLDLINKILRHPDVYESITDDFSPPVDEFTAEDMLRNPNIYVLMRSGVELHMFFPWNSLTFEAHVITLKPGRGNSVLKGAVYVGDYMVEHTKCRKLVSLIPPLYPRAMLYAEKLGFLKVGMVDDCHIRNGRVYPKIIYTIDPKKILGIEETDEKTTFDLTTLAYGDVGPKRYKYVVHKDAGTEYIRVE